jgi:hypothetical protein
LPKSLFTLSKTFFESRHRWDSRRFENSEAVLCASEPDTRECNRESLRWFVQGGPMPGVASIKKPYLLQVGLDMENLIRVEAQTEELAFW